MGSPVWRYDSLREMLSVVGIEILKIRIINAANAFKTFVFKIKT